MTLRETGQTVYIDEFSCPLTVFQTCEMDYIPAFPSSRYWGAQAQFLSDGHTQRHDPFYTPERFQRYCSRIAVYTRAAQAASYTTVPETLDDSGLFDEENLL